MNAHVASIALWCVLVHTYTHYTCVLSNIPSLDKISQLKKNKHQQNKHYNLQCKKIWELQCTCTCINNYFLSSMSTTCINSLHLNQTCCCCNSDNARDCSNQTCWNDIHVYCVQWYTCTCDTHIHVHVHVLLHIFMHNYTCTWTRICEYFPSQLKQEISSDINLQSIKQRMQCTCSRLWMCKIPYQWHAGTFITDLKQKRKTYMYM